MSFYHVIKQRFPGASEIKIAKHIGKPRSTFRQWRHVVPTAVAIHEVALRLNERPGEFFEEFMADYLSEHSEDTPSQQCA